MLSAANDLAVCFGTTTVEQRSGIRPFHLTGCTSPPCLQRPTQLTDPTALVVRFSSQPEIKLQLAR